MVVVVVVYCYITIMVKLLMSICEVVVFGTNEMSTVTLFARRLF